MTLSIQIRINFRKRSLFGAGVRVGAGEDSRPAGCKTWSEIKGRTPDDRFSTSDKRHSDGGDKVESDDKAGGTSLPSKRAG